MTTKVKKRPSVRKALADQIARLSTESAIAAAPIPAMGNGAPLTRLEASNARKASARVLSNARRKVMRQKEAVKRGLHRRA